MPTAKLLERVESDPVLPLEWGRNKAGMSASDVLSARRGGRGDARLACSARRCGSRARESYSI